MSTTMLPARASLLALPRELRDLVYDHLLPENAAGFNHSAGTFPAKSIFNIANNTSNAGKRSGLAGCSDIEALQAVHPLFADEITEHMNNKCRVLQFVVSPHVWTAPAPIHTFPHLVGVFIEIGACDDASVRIMQHNSCAFVAWLRSCNESIGTIRIDFEDDDQEIPGRNPWIAQVRTHQHAEGPGVRLATTRDGAAPLMQLMLLPFLDLPKVRGAMVGREGIEEGDMGESSDFRARNREARFDRGYLVALREVMEDWLMGHRDGAFLEQVAARVEEEKGSW